MAKKQHLKMSRALVALAQRAVKADAPARDHINTTHQRFMAETHSARKDEAGKDLIRAIFGKAAIAEDAIL